MTITAPGTGTTGLRSVVRVFVAAFAVFLALGVSWAMTSPLMSVPDEPAHAVHAAAVVRGELHGRTSEHVGWTVVRVPQYVADTPGQLCWAFDPDKSASCSPALTDSAASREARTTAGGYDPLYYAVVGTPTLVMSGAPAIYAMRLVSVVMNAALLAGAAVALMRLRRRGFAMVALSVAITPMVLWLSASINPNGTEIAAGVMTFAWLANLVQDRAAGGVRAHQVVLVAIPAVILANTRSIAMLWLLAYLVATLSDRAVLRRLGRSRAFWVGVVVIGAGVLVAAVWTLQSQSLAVSNPAAGVGQSFPRAAATMLSLTFEYVRDYVGLFGLLDTPVPASTGLVWGALMIAVIVAGLVLGRGRSRRTAFLTTAALVLLPVIVQGQATHDYGMIWQARYNLALVTAALLAAGIALDDAFPDAFSIRGVRTLGTVALVAVVVMHVHTSVWVAHRWVTGVDLGWEAMVRNPEWQPPGTWELWTAVTAVAAAAGAWFVLRTVRTDGAATGQEARVTDPAPAAAPSVQQDPEPAHEARDEDHPGEPALAQQHQAGRRQEHRQQ